MADRNTQAAAVGTGISVAVSSGITSAAAGTVLQGTAALGPIAAIVGALVAAVVVPALFPEEDVDGDNLDGVPVGGASEGSPKVFTFGPNARAKGHVIWATPIRVVEQDVGKGGLFGTEIERQKRSLAYCFSWNEVAEVESIQADGVKVFDTNNILTIASTQMRAAQIVAFGSGTNPDIPGARVYIADSGDVDLLQVRSGIDVVISGFLEATYNGTFTASDTISGPFSSAQVSLAAGETAFVVRADALEPIVADEDANGAYTINVSQTLPVLDAGFSTEVDKMLGASGQGVSSIMSSFEGAGIPEYNNRCVVVFRDVDVTNSGGRAPNCVGIISESLTQTIAQLIGKILARVAKFSAADYDTSLLAARDASGFSYSATRSAEELLIPLLIAYRIDAQDRNGVLTFFDRDSADTHTITDEDLQAHGLDSDHPGGPVRWAEREERDFPSLVQLEYIDSANDYQRGLVPVRIPTAPRENVFRVRVPAAFTPDEAKCQAQAIAYDLWAQEYEAELPLKSSLFTIIEGDVIEYARFGVTHELRVLAVNHFENGVNQAICKSIDSVTEDQLIADCDAQEQPSAGSLLYIPSEVDAVPLDIPAMFEQDTTRFLMYWQNSRQDDRGLYRGATYYESTDGGTTFFSRDSATSESAVGKVLADLQSASPLAIDELNTLSVKMFSGTPESSVTDTELRLLQSNIAAVGHPSTGFEIIAYRDVVQTDDDEFDLTGLLRGLRGTEFRIGTHTADEWFVPLVNNQTLEEFLRNPSELGVEVQTKGVSAGGVESSFNTEFTFTIRLESVAPLGPDVIGQYIAAQNNFYFKFRRRDRTLQSPWLMSTIPNTDGQTTVAFSYDILNGATVVRTVNTTNSVIQDPPSNFYPTGTWFVYTGAQQIEDFGGTQTSITMDVYEVGPNGRGNPTRITIPG